MVPLSRRQFFGLTAVSVGSLTCGGGCGTFTEREVRLKPGTYRTEKLRSLDDFWVSADKLWRPRKRA